MLREDLNDKSYLYWLIIDSTKHKIVYERSISFFQYSSPSKHDPLCKYDNARFTTAPLKALSDHVWIKYHVNQALSMLLDQHENKKTPTKRVCLVDILENVYKV